MHKCNGRKILRPIFQSVRLERYSFLSPRSLRKNEVNDNRGETLAREFWKIGNSLPLPVAETFVQFAPAQNRMSPILAPVISISCRKNRPESSHKKYIWWKKASISVRIIRTHNDKTYEHERRWIRARLTFVRPIVTPLQTSYYQRPILQKKEGRKRDIY